MYNCIFGDPVDDLGAPATASTTSFSFATSTCTTASTTIATSSDVVIVPTITGGEVLISLLLLIVIVILASGAIIAALSPIRIGRKVIERSAEYGKEEHTL
jgi:uncharacterized protein (DUF58 family)